LLDAILFSGSKLILIRYPLLDATIKLFQE